MAEIHRLEVIEGQGDDEIAEINIRFRANGQVGVFHDERLHNISLSKICYASFMLHELISEFIRAERPISTAPDEPA